MPNIKIKKENGRYAIYIDEEFRSTCENMSEVAEEMEELRVLYGKPKGCNG